MVRPRAWRSGRARRALGGRARFLSLQFQTELRKILLSLIEVAQKLLALSPGAVELFTKANGTRPAGAGCGNRVRTPVPRLRRPPAAPRLGAPRARGLPSAPARCRAIVPVCAGGDWRPSQVL